MPQKTGFDPLQLERKYHQYHPYPRINMEVTLDLACAIEKKITVKAGPE